MTAPKVLKHRVRVFVFQYAEKRLNYLLLRKRPRVEHDFGPVRGGVELDEHLQDAVLREVREETGLLRPAHLIDLDHTSTRVFGDEGLVHWEFGYQAPNRAEAAIHPGPQIAESLWLGFERAFEALENPDDRAALVRLQMHLRAG